ncbi:membrane protein [Streptomyces sp. NRRL F-4711]|uniref:hypothetical protein n=1 Tax=unclassified Streptomyces TaxID=2593676 RepID=UPI0004C27A21|nr:MULTISPECIES: hypothetical protein [unclassified Streptomyces]KOU05347.1 membrane protein [Streptomyces sp. NRRL F-4711]
MGRWCTARRRAGTGRAGPKGPALPTAFTRTAVVAAVLATTAALPGATVLAAGPAGTEAADAAGPSAGYDFADGAVPVAGASDTAGAETLAAGSVYRSSLPRNGTRYYRLDLDAASDAYVSVTAIPGPGGEVTAVDGIRVSVRDADGGSCSVHSATFGAARSPRPVTAWGMRETGPGGTRCQDPGTYYVGVERTRPQDSPPDDWDLELTVATEPGLRQAGATKAPETWASASPEPLDGEPERRAGGSGFAHATLLGQGVWRDDIRPGQTLYYRVPVDWGRQVYATAELAGSADASGYATGALRLALHNPVRGEVVDAAKGYTGRRTTVGLAPLPPVAYPNRYATAGRVAALRFAGDYYLVVHLAAQAADDFGQGPFGLTLRLRLGGAARSGPGYAGESRPQGLFEVSARNRIAAPGSGSGTAGDDTAMKAVAVGGIGTGSLLLVGLAVWTAATRRRT